MILEQIKNKPTKRRVGLIVKGAIARGEYADNDMTCESRGNTELMQVNYLACAAIQLKTKYYSLMADKLVFKIF